MLVECCITALLPEARVTGRVKAAKHDGSVLAEIVEEDVRQSGYEHPPHRSVEDWLSRRILVDECQSARNRSPETLDSLGTVRLIPTHDLGQIRLGLWCQTDAHSLARMRACTSSQVLSCGELTA
jgi:hypothetical protein